VSTLPANPSSPSNTAAAQSKTAAARQRAVIVVAVCTLLCSIAQFLIKVGVGPDHLQVKGSGLVPLVLAMVTDWPLIGGYACYGLFTVAMVVALREGELSKLFPIIALTYVWVTLLSYWLLKEPANWYKNVGIATIVLGVAILGQGGERK
jgi:drug/metabolite transporter (DMT)-like permease